MGSTVKVVKSNNARQGRSTSLKKKTTAPWKRRRRSRADLKTPSPSRIRQFEPKNPSAKKKRAADDDDDDDDEKASPSSSSSPDGGGRGEVEEHRCSSSMISE